MTDSSRDGEGRREGLLPRSVVIVAAFACAAILLVVSLLGPLALGVIRYRTPASGIAQTIGVDLVNLILIVPLLLIGGILYLARKDGAKYFLILTPITLFSLAMEYGVGQEWGNPAYAGNVERFVWLFILLIIGALVLLVGSLSLFTENDAPRFQPRSLLIYVGLVGVLLAMFAAMWISEMLQVTTTGDTSTGSYSDAPVAFWTVRLLDLGITIPLGFIGLFLLLTRTERAYPLVLLFWGFFVTMGTSVVAMALVMVLNHDPTAQPEGLIIFPLLAIMAWAGLLYLVKDKLPWSGRARLLTGPASP